MISKSTFVALAVVVGQFGICSRPAVAAEQDTIAAWTFDRVPTNGVYPGTGHPARLRGGAEHCETGRSGACLQSFRGTPTIKTPGGVSVPNSPELTPKGAFTLDLSICPDKEFFSTIMAFLLDKKYLHYPSAEPRFNCDYQLHLTPTSREKWIVTANLGFGKDSVNYRSRPISLEVGKWCQIAFTYDGAGTGRIYHDGLMVCETHHGNRHRISAGSYPLIIGDRAGRDHYPFPGRIDRVRITDHREEFHSGKLLLDVGRPQAFRRMSENSFLAVAIRNDLGSSFRNGVLETSLAGETIQSIAIDEIEENGRRICRIPVDTTLRPGIYPYQFVVYDADKEGQALASRKVDVSIVARPTPLRMPVVMWGHADLKKVQAAGFSHSFVTLVDCRNVWHQGPAEREDCPVIADGKAEALDQALVDGFGVVAYIGAARFLHSAQGDLLRVDRLGKKNGKHKNLCGLFPEAQTFCYNAGAAVAGKYGAFPALEGALLETETRDGTSLCFHQHDHKAFRDFAGYDIPENIGSKFGVVYSTLDSFPPGRIIPDDDPMLTYLKWFWERGDGWNSIYTQIHHGLKSTGREDLWTWYDPAVRVPSVAGSGGEADFISQWTYCYPDPIKIGKATDELLAMADLSPNRKQKVMKTTQAIWYRSYTAPKRQEGEESDVPLAAWEGTKADANFITIAPDHLREAFWSKMSRPIGGIMYHGWWSLVDENQNNPYKYRHTNPESQHVLKELVETVVAPLGPTLLQVPDLRSDVAFLQSFASEMFAGVGEFGWGWGWENDAYQILRYAHLQPRIVFDETILRRGLADFKVLVLVKCPVLTRKVADVILAFQERGGIIVGDENLAPEISPDVLLSACGRSKKPDRDKAALQRKASELRRELTPFYTPHAETDNPDVLVRLRRHETTDYLFALNDKRTFGDYVGQFGLVMEKGLSTEATLIVNRRKGFVYDLVARTPVRAFAENGKMKISAALGPGGGHIYMITENSISAVTVAGKRRVRRGGTLDARIAVVDEHGDPIKAVVPISAEILNPQGEVEEFSGFYGARNGQLTISLDMAFNDPLGKWTVRIEELASAKRAQHEFELAP
ncbi:MAG: LamG domain-containing protein [Lentisphaeria bacterium]|nr:LamG domain-containing protein [Lentisphaeria bacterium]